MLKFSYSITILIIVGMIYKELIFKKGIFLSGKFVYTILVGDTFLTWLQKNCCYKPKSQKINYRAIICKTFSFVSANLAKLEEAQMVSLPECRVCRSSKKPYLAVNHFVLKDLIWKSFQTSNRSDLTKHLFKNQVKIPLNGIA